MDKVDIVNLLEEIAVLLELKGDNPFKIRAYATGARTLETLEEDFADLMASGQLASVRGIGSALAEKIQTLYETGRLAFYEDLKASIAPGLIEMLEIPGLGGKKVKRLHDELGVETIEALKIACEKGEVAALKGFGAKSQEKILSGIENRAAYAKRHLWWEARAMAQPILEGLRQLEGVEQAELAGSLRRLMETVGDLDFIVASSAPEKVMDWFTRLDSVKEVTAKGTTKASVRLEGGLQADLRVVPLEQFAFALHHFTGSKEHNVAMRQRALARGYSLSEWGLSRRDEGAFADGNGNAESGKNIGSEADLFAFLDLPEIPPELREGMGELELKKTPKLVSKGQLQGVFHNHTTASDGRASIAQMAEAAASYGWAYLGLADHSKASFQAKGMDDARVLRQLAEIRAFNESKQSPVMLFAGIECDILKDGSLDLEDQTLEALDYTVMSVHSSFGLSEAEMTARVIRAVEHPATTMLGHPTGRLLLRREPYKIDLQKVIDACIANRVIIEINANPKRLDLDWRLWRRAAERGLMCAINPDAHSTAGLSYFEAGVNVARKGAIPVEQILNCRNVAGVALWFRDRK